MSVDLIGFFFFFFNAKTIREDVVLEGTLHFSSILIPPLACILTAFPPAGSRQQWSILTKTLSGTNNELGKMHLS